MSSASFTLVNTADLGGSASMELTATLGDPNDPSASPVVSQPLTQEYIEPTTDPFTQPTSGTLYDEGQNTYNGSQFEYYIQNSAESDYGSAPAVSGAGSGNSFIDSVGETNDSVQGGTGNDTIHAVFGSGGDDVIQGSGGQDVLFGAGDPSNLTIYGDSAADLQTAIADANAHDATGQAGDLIISQVSAATIVGSTGSDLIMDAGNDMVVAGPGNDTILSGVDGEGDYTGYDSTQFYNTDEIVAGMTWSISTQQNGSGPALVTLGGVAMSGTETAPTAGYEGNSDNSGHTFLSTNSTIFGGSGNDLILLSNGNNDVELGTGSSSVYGGMGSDTIIGGGGADLIYGGGGDDYIEAGEGNSTVVGEGGNNTIIGGAGNDSLYAGDAGQNWATAQTGNNYVEAGSGDTVIFGSGGDDTLIGGAGNDTIGAGAGNESIVGGSGNEQIVGGAGNDTLDAGGDGADSIWAGSGSTTMYGGDGQDSLVGGAGTDVIYVGDGGTDSGVSYASAGTGDTTIYGGDGVDQLDGGSGNDVIYAGDGGDTILASTVYVGSGNATVYGGDGIDVINGGSGTDVLYAGDGGIDGFATAVNAGSGVTTLYGGAGVSVLTDSVGGSDQLVGGDGTSDMYGIGNDTFVAGTGQELMSGTGSNTYVFNADGGYDEVANAGGTETLDFSYDDDPTDDVTVSAGTLADGTPALMISDNQTTVLVDGGLTGANVAAVDFGNSQSESLVQLVQSADAAGNALDTVIAGTNGNLTFDTGSGDSLEGGTGQDTISAWGANDVVNAGSGGSAIYAEGASAQVFGGSGMDTLAAYGANTTLTGGTGNESFYVNDSTEVVYASGAAASNALFTSVSYTLPTHVDVATLIGNGNITVSGNSEATNLITGNSGNDEIDAGSNQDTLVSGSGVDTLVGGRGTDTFVINNSADVIDLPDGGAHDTVQSSVSYTVNGVGALQLTGTQNLVGEDVSGSARITGNSGQDTLIGGSGSDTLVAGSGADTLVTGTGATTLVVNSAADSIVASSGAHGDTLISSVSESLLGGLDTLELTGSDNLTGQGNADATNLMTANSGHDVLIAGSGTDTLTAGVGDDTLIAGSGTDLLDGQAGQSETFVLNAGFGTATLLLASQNSVIQFGQGISASDLTVSTVVDSFGNLALQISDGSSVVTIDDGTSQGLSAFNLPNENLTFNFAGEGQMSLAELLATAQVASSTLPGTNGDLVLDGAGGASPVYGGAGDDTLMGAGTGDTLVAGIGGSQALYGYGNEEQLVGSVGGDTLYGFGNEDTLSAGSGNTVMYAGGEANAYMLTAGTSSTIVPDGDQGPQTLYLPFGMTISDFTSYTLGEDLYLVSGGTSVLIKGFYTDPNAGNWELADSAGDGTPLSLWAAQNSNSGGTSGGGTRVDPDYQNEITGLQLVYSANMASTLKSLGDSDETIADPGDSRNPNYYTFNGVADQSITVPSGATIDIPTSENDDWQTVAYNTHYVTVTYDDPIFGVASYAPSSGYYPIGTEYPVGAGYTRTPVYSPSGQFLGYDVTGPAASGYQQTGTQTGTQTIEVSDYYTTDSQGFTLYNVTGQGSNITITAGSQFVGTVETGDGNDVNVQLGLTIGVTESYGPGWSLSPGAFIDVGNGLDDFILGTDGVDTIAAGLGVDTIEASLGSTVYVPLEGASIDTIYIDNPPFYGSAPFPHNTLVLPEGVTPEDLQFKLFAGVPGYSAADLFQAAPETLQVTYGDSTLLLEFDSGAPSGYLNGATSDDTAGINYFQFADGTTLTRTQVLALAGAAITPNDTYNPVITQSTTAVAGNSTVSGAGLFTSSDASGSTVSVYRIVNNATDGAYFTLSGQTYGEDAEFDVAANQLSQLQLVTGNGNGSEAFVVSGFDGWAWGQTTDVQVNVTLPGGTSVFQATAADQTVQGASTGPDTLTGGYDGDVLEGNSGQDTFTYASGGGAETIDESAPITLASANTLQFGTGITASALTATLNADGSLTLTTGTTGDSVTIEGFNPLDPLSSMPIQQFGFVGSSGLSFAQLVSQVQSSGTEQDVTNADGTTTAYGFNADWGPNGPVYYAKLLSAQGQLTQQYILNADGTTQTDNYAYGTDGSYSDTEVQTTAAGVATTTVTDIDAQGDQTSTLTTYPNGSTDYVTYDSQGRHATEIQTDASGATSDSTYSYNSDGSFSVTAVDTPAGGGATTTVVSDVDSQGNLVSTLQTNPDGSTEYDSWNDQGQPLSEVNTAADGSSNSTTWAYNADGSYTTTELETPVGGAPATTEVVSYDSSGNELNDNSYTPGTNGSYSDDWTKPDGSSGGYWWNSSTQEYQASWNDSNGTTWTDDYQYASGGSPGSTGVSFTETYSDSSGDQGSRQYDASTGATTVTWYSATTGTITGTVTDSGFIGLQNEGELTNTQPDLSFFNPTVSPAFQSFLAGH